jgi:hypothetical protein
VELKHKLEGTQIDLRNIVVDVELQQFVGFLEVESAKTK